MIYSIGEMLIDFMQEGSAFFPHPGGAPANVAAHARRSGADAVFIGKMSQDPFGKLLIATLREHDIYWPLELSSKNTTLAVVSHNDGERSFQFYRENTADLELCRDDFETVNFTPDDILHFCSLGLVPSGTTFDAHQFASAKCNAAGGIVSFDINLREGLWPDLEIARKHIMKMLPLVNIVKVNETELVWLTGTNDYEKGMRALQLPNQLIFCTLGSHGSMALTPRGSLLHVTAPTVQQVDTTGAGDSYIAIILSAISQSPHPFMTWVETDLEKAMIWASHVSAHVVSKVGAIPTINYKNTLL